MNEVRYWERQMFPVDDRETARVEVDENTFLTRKLIHLSARDTCSGIALSVQVVHELYYLPVAIRYNSKAGLYYFYEHPNPDNFPRKPLEPANAALLKALGAGQLSGDFLKLSLNSIFYQEVFKPACDGDVIALELMNNFPEYFEEMKRLYKID